MVATANYYKQTPLGNLTKDPLLLPYGRAQYVGCANDDKVFNWAEGSNYWNGATRHGTYSSYSTGSYATIMNLTSLKTPIIISGFHSGKSNSSLGEHYFKVTLDGTETEWHIAKSSGYGGGTAYAGGNPVTSLSNATNAFGLRYGYQGLNQDSSHSSNGAYGTTHMYTICMENALDWHGLGNICLYAEDSFKFEVKSSHLSGGNAANASVWWKYQGYASSNFWS